MANKTLAKPNSGNAVDNKHTGVTGKETQPDNSKCQGTTKNDTGPTGADTND